MQNKTHSFKEEFKGALNPETHASFYERKNTFKFIYFKGSAQLGPTRRK